MRSTMALISVLSFVVLGQQSVRADSPHELVHDLEREAHKVADYADRVIVFVPQAQSIHDSALAICDRSHSLLAGHGVSAGQLQAVQNLYAGMLRQAEYWEEATDSWSGRRHFRGSNGEVLRGDDLEERFDALHDAVHHLGDVIEDLCEYTHHHAPSRHHASSQPHAPYGNYAPQGGVYQGQSYAPSQSYYRYNGGQGYNVPQVQQPSYGPPQQYQQPAQVPSARLNWTDYVRMLMDARR